MVKFLLRLLLAILSISSCSSKTCNNHCLDCHKYSTDTDDMQCISCQENLNILYNTTNCVEPSRYLNYYKNQTDLILYPCSFIADENCYECDPYLTTAGICLSCLQGFKYNNDTNKCQKCQENEFSIIKGDFNKCKRPFTDLFCDLYKTYCEVPETENIICPDEAYIFDKRTNTCYEYECPNNGLENGNCYITNKKYKNRNIFVNWFNNNTELMGYPSYNVDRSGYLLVEMTLDVSLCKGLTYSLTKNPKRKLFF